MYLFFYIGTFGDVPVSEKVLFLKNCTLSQRSLIAIHGDLESITVCHESLNANCSFPALLIDFRRQQECCNYIWHKTLLLLSGNCMVYDTTYINYRSHC